MPVDKYPWADDTQSGSLALPFETVLERGGQADTWLVRYSSNLTGTTASYSQAVTATAS